LGPAKVLVPVIGYAILYPVILSVSGPEVLGLWSLIAAVFAYLNFADFGFSQLIVRRIASMANAESKGTDTVRKELLAIWRFYAALAVLLVAVVLISTTLFSDELVGLSVVYEPARVGLALAMAILAASMMQWNKTQEMVLGAFADNAFATVVNGVTPISLFAVAISGAVAGAPIEALALGNLLCALLRTLILSARLRAKHGLRVSRHTDTWAASAKTALSLGMQGKSLYTASVGLFVREPTLRLCIASVAGLGSLAAYDIAQRVTGVIRTALSGGFGALFPAMSSLYALREWDALRASLRAATVLMVGVGVVCLGGFLVVAAPLYRLWLGSAPRGLVQATALLALWHVVTLTGSAYWYLLLATGRERLAAGAVWFQVVVVLFTWLVGKQVSLSLESILVVWLVSSVVVQGLIYRAAESELGLVVPVVRSRWFIWTVGSGWALAVLVAGVIVVVEPSANWAYPAMAGCVAAYAAGLALSFWPRRNDLRESLGARALGSRAAVVRCRP
jgi:O-antigen/teichoic acid export membrane protein